MRRVSDNVLAARVMCLIVILLTLVLVKVASAQELTISTGWQDAGDLGYEPGPVINAEFLISDARWMLRAGGDMAFTSKTYTEGDGTAYAAWVTGSRFWGALGLTVQARYSGWQLTHVSSKDDWRGYVGPTIKLRGARIDALLSDDAYALEGRGWVHPGLSLGLRYTYLKDYGDSLTALVGWRIGR